MNTIIRRIIGLLMIMCAGGYTDHLISASSDPGTLSWMISPQFAIVIVIMIAGNFVIG